VRYSGTQPLCRVMVESPDPDQTAMYGRLIADSIRKILGRREKNRTLQG